MRSLLTSVREFQVWMTQQYRCMFLFFCFFAGVAVLYASDAFVLASPVIRIAMHCLCLGEKLWELSGKRVSSADKKEDKKKRKHTWDHLKALLKRIVVQLLQAIWLISIARSYCDCPTCFIFSLSYISEICRGSVCFDTFACWAAGTRCSYEHISFSHAFW